MRRPGLGTGAGAPRTASTAGVRTASRAGPIAPSTAMPTTDPTVSAMAAGVATTSMRPMRADAMRVSTEEKGWSTARATRTPGAQATSPSTATVVTTPTSTCRGEAPASRHPAQFVRRAWTQERPTIATTGIAVNAE